MSSINWLKQYPVDSLQIYFASSLELQEELINHGFQVPKDKNDKIKMPIPLIYSNFRGWLKTPNPITIERLIPPEWLDMKPQDLEWEEVRFNNKRAFKLPQEEVYVNVGVSGDAVIFVLDVKSYHLERVSIRGVNPEKWTNWVMFYIDLSYLTDIVNVLGNFIPNQVKNQVQSVKVEKELQQGEKEVTYYAVVPVKDFSFCLGCFDLALKYLKIKAEEHKKLNLCSKPCPDPDKVVSSLKLRIKYNSHAFAKVGIAKIQGKRPQIMIKLASEGQKTISGILKSVVEGKPRGELVYCDHENKSQYITLDLISFWRALNAIKSYVSLLPP
ncbi:hypothetical protein V6M85_04075 [Sulfolobus tengchongensis]|uniref:PhoI n=1 Tax=Sulfolobus tengchongensis TaxID=207809 RepID=A0AAX4L2Q1_9CREN